MPIQAFQTYEKKLEDGSAELLPSGEPNVGISIHPVKEFVKPYWISDKSVSALAANGQETLFFPIDQQGHFDWMALMGTFSVNPVMLQILDAQPQRLLSNKPVHSTTVIGSGKRYFRLPFPYFINIGDGQREVKIRVINAIPGAASTITNLQMYGRRFYSKEMPGEMAAEITKKFDSIWKEYAYCLVPDEYDVNGVPTVVAANGRATFTYKLDDTADLECFKLTLASTGSFTFDLFENDKQRPIMSGEILSGSGFGNAEFPFPFGDSFLFRRKRQLLLRVTDISGAPNYIFATITGNMLQYK